MNDFIQKARDLRKNLTEAEKLLWSKLRNRQLQNLKFKRQYPYPPYILDFYCEERKTAIELDGGQHNLPENSAKDLTRDNFLNEKGICVLRFWNNDVMNNIEGVLREISLEMGLDLSPSPHPSPEGRRGEKRILIGEIASSHGVKGLVKLRIFAEDETLLNGVVFTSQTGDQTLALTLKNAMKDHWLAEVKGITEKNGADSLRGTKLYIDRAALPPSEDEFYIEDLKGMRVIDTNGTVIGIVLDIYNYGASDILEIKPQTGTAVLLPFTDDVVLAIDQENGVITAQLPEVL